MVPASPVAEKPVKHPSPDVMRAGFDVPAVIAGPSRLLRWHGGVVGDPFCLRLVSCEIAVGFLLERDQICVGLYKS